MSAEVIKFPTKPIKHVPTPEEIQNQTNQLIENCIDRGVQSLVIDMVEKIPELNWELVEDIDPPTQKIIALMRECMRATILKFQDRHHDLQDIALELIEFEEDARELIIEDNN